ncbi:MAG: serine/threonine protein kinase [Kofleriaceae bacterium]|nr:serine/threonine protein kinase [Kofleriaceae bacterium]
MTECPSAERLASNAMTPDERASWLDHAAVCSQCHAIAMVMSSAPVGPAEPSERIGRFVIGRELGRGAMGTVYAAEDPELARPIAIKVLHDATAADRLRREARALARLDHPNVVRVYDVGMTGEHAFVAMELIAGENLRRWLQAAPRKLPEIVDVIMQAGRGLAAAHAAGIVHRDFKPDNVLVAPGRVVVGDFGLSRLGGELVDRTGTSSLDVPSEDKLTVTGAVIGTPAYMAPEQASGEATPASDQFAFCVAAWEALFDARPFSGTTLRELREQASGGRVLRPVGAAVPRRIERALRRGLSARTEDRFASMDALLAAIAPRRGRWAIAAGVAVVAIAAGVWWLLSRPQVDPCEREGNAIFADWTDAARQRVATALGEDRAAQLARYAEAWRDSRTALCRAPSTRDPSEVEHRAARTACYERARVELARWLRDPASTQIAQGRTIPLAACENVALTEAPGTAADPRGCGCPYSPCTEGACTGECNARAFRMVGPIAGIAVPGRQEAVCGATADGSRLLYLTGDERCVLDHLYIADRTGGRYESFDLTPQLVGHDVAVREGCCTISRDGSALLVERKSAPGFIRFPLAGTTLGAPEAATATGITAGTRVWQPVLSRDDRELYYLTDLDEHGWLYKAVRPAPGAPFEQGAKVAGRAQSYEYATGISDDGLTLFMASEWVTRPVVRESIDAPFGDLAPAIPPPRLPGWRAIPIQGCQQLVTTITPGGCESEEPTLFEAVRM